jgi:hypothetical protein
MSPRCTKALHQIGNCQHLGAVVVVGFERGDFCSEGGFVMESGRCLDESGTDRFGAGHAGCLELAERTERPIVKAD